MALPLKAVLRAAFGTVLVLYPFWAWYGLSHWGPAAVAAGLAAVTFCRALVTRSREDWILSVIAACLCAAAAFSGLEEPMRLYPVLVNAFLLWAFGTTLLPNRMPMVERFARMKDSVLPPEAVRWCRGVTQVWCGFFILNGAAALVTVFFPERRGYSGTGVFPISPSACSLRENGFFVLSSCTGVKDKNNVPSS